MAPTPDPYRTLGLGRDASIEEIRRAYRRLAKANHPDSAGEAALPRFLAIQAAYEMLVGGAAPGLGLRRPGARPGGRTTGGPQREPWRADPDRARATPGAQRPSGRRPGTRPPGGRTARDAPGSASGTASGGPGGAADPAGQARGSRGGRRRAPNKATLGSTTYDAAAEDPAEPSWSGGTWYGATSGTYWTINPKEYADPRKHGPEYQRRARRPLDRTDAFGDEAGPDPTLGEAPGAADDEGRWRAYDFAGDSGSGPAEPPPSDSLAPTGFGISLPGGFGGRVALALFGWPPLGVALATASGELTGCGRFAASCVELFGIGTWLAQLVIIAILLAAPGLAAISAMGTVFALAAAVPTAVILSATGGAQEPAASAIVLGVAVGVAYVAGVAFALVRRAQGRHVPWPR